MFRWTEHIDYSEYSTEMSDLPQHIQTRRSEIVRQRRVKWVWTLAIGAMVALAVLALLMPALSH